MDSISASHGWRLDDWFTALYFGDETSSSPVTLKPDRVICSCNIECNPLRLFFNWHSLLPIKKTKTKKNRKSEVHYCSYTYRSSAESDAGESLYVNCQSWPKDFKLSVNYIFNTLNFYVQLLKIFQLFNEIPDVCGFE